MSESAQQQTEETNRIDLYIWPHSWNLPSFDIDCLAITLYLQLAIHRHKNTKQLPHHYRLVECTDPDLSPSGTLPFLVHGSEKISTFTGIVRYLESVGLELDETNTKKGEDYSGYTEGATKKAKRVAWISLVDSQLRDLVNHTLYAQPENYRKGIHTALVNVLPIPSRYYLPSRLRSAVQTSLEPAGLWTTRDEEEEAMKKKKHPFEKEKDQVVEEKDSIIKETFGKEKLLHKARDTFDLLTPLLKQPHSHSHHHHHREYFLSNHPTALDTLLASHVLLLKHAPLPNNHILPLLKDSYPTLLEHAERILALAFPANAEAPVRGDVEVTQAPHANPIIQLTRAVGRTLQAVLPVATSA